MQCMHVTGGSGLAIIAGACTARTCSRHEGYITTIWRANPLHHRRNMTATAEEVPALHSDEVQAILTNPPPLACHFSEPAKIVPMARFMVTATEQWVECYVRFLQVCKRIAQDPTARRFVLRAEVGLLPVHWDCTRIMIYGCAANMPQDRSRLVAAETKAGGEEKKRAGEQLAEFDGYMRRLEKAQDKAKKIERDIEEAYAEYSQNPIPEGEDPTAGVSRDALATVGAATMQFETDEKTCRQVFLRLAAAGCQCEHCGIPVDQSATQAAQASLSR